MATIYRKQPRVPEASQQAISAVMARIAQLSPVEFADMQELLDLYHQTGSGDQDHAGVAAAIQELLYPQGLTATVDPSAVISPQTRAKLQRYQAQVGSAIRQRREALNVTQQQLAAKAAIQQSHLSRLENGQHRASGRTMYRIAKALRINLNLLDPGFDD